MTYAEDLKKLTDQQLLIELKACILLIRLDEQKEVEAELLSRINSAYEKGWEEGYKEGINDKPM